MNKKELIEKVSKKTMMSKDEVNAVLCSTINQIVTEITNGGKVDIRNFATFTSKVKKSKKGYNFATKQTIDIEERRVPVIRFCKYLKEL